jgi:hypothetical protein
MVLDVMCNQRSELLDEGRLVLLDLHQLREELLILALLLLNRLHQQFDRLGQRFVPLDQSLQAFVNAHFLPRFGPAKPV